MAHCTGQQNQANHRLTIAEVRISKCRQLACRVWISRGGAEGLCGDWKLELNRQDAECAKAIVPECWFLLVESQFLGVLAVSSGWVVGAGTH